MGGKTTSVSGSDFQVGEHATGATSGQTALTGEGMGWRNTTVPIVSRTGIVGGDVGKGAEEHPGAEWATAT